MNSFSEGYNSDGVTCRLVSRFGCIVMTLKIFNLSIEKFPATLVMSECSFELVLTALCQIICVTIVYSRIIKIYLVYLSKLNTCQNFQ